MRPQPIEQRLLLWSDMMRSCAVGSQRSLVCELAAPGCCSVGCLSAWMMEFQVVVRLLMMLCFWTLHSSAIETGKPAATDREEQHNQKLLLLDFISKLANNLCFVKMIVIKK